MKKDNQPHIPVKALQLPKSVSLKKVEDIFKVKLQKSIDSSYFCEITDKKTIFFYRFSAIVFVGFSTEEVAYYYEEITQGTKEEIQIHQDYEIIIDESQEKDFLLHDMYISLKRCDREVLEIIAFALSHTVAMEYYENITESFFQKINFYEDIKMYGEIRMKEKALLKFIAELLSVKHRIVSELYLFDMPEIVWEDISLEKLYKSLYAFFDINDRFKAIEYKLNFMSENITFLYDALDTKKAHTLEWIVIGLILFEIFFSFFEFFSRHF